MLNLIWQILHHFPTLEDLHNVRASGKNVVLPPLQFIKQQILVMGPALLPIWFAGLWHFLAGRGSKFRELAWIFLAFFIMMMILHGKDYYVVPMYPMLFAGGAVAWESALKRWRFTRGRFWPKAAICVLILASDVAIAPIMMPILSPEKALAYSQKLGFAPAKTEVGRESLLPSHFADQFGWEEMVQQVAEIYNSLPPEERAATGILAGNYGEAGAIDLFGPKYGLPRAYSRHQTYWYWGPPTEDYRNLIFLQFSL